MIVSADHIVTQPTPKGGEMGVGLAMAQGARKSPPSSCDVRAGEQAAATFDEVESVLGWPSQPADNAAANFPVLAEAGAPGNLIKALGVDWSRARIQVTSNQPLETEQALDHLAARTGGGRAADIDVSDATFGEGLEVEAVGMHGRASLTRDDRLMWTRHG